MFRSISGIAGEVFDEGVLKIRALSYCKCSNAHILIEYTSLVITVWSFSSRALSTLKLISCCLVKITIAHIV